MSPNQGRRCVPAKKGGFRKSSALVLQRCTVGGGGAGFGERSAEGCASEGLDGDYLERPLVGFPAPRHTVGGRVWNRSGELAFPGRQRESAQTVINY